MSFVENRSLLKTLILISQFWLSTTIMAQNPNIGHTGLRKLEYNNPGLLVDLDVGFKSVPMPMDFDGDGDIDLLVSASGSYVESGVFYFENISKDLDNPVFRAGGRISSDRFRLGADGKYFAVSNIDGHIHVLTPDRVNEELLIYKDVPENVFWDKSTIPPPASGFLLTRRNNTWKMIDFDGDSVVDLISGQAGRDGDRLLFFRNAGSNDLPMYEAAQEVQLPLADLRDEDLYLEVAIADFDNDLDLDYIAVSSFSNIHYFENIGTPDSYRYEESTILTYERDTIQCYSHYGHAIKLRTVDFDQDGWIDIIAGDEEGKVSLLKNTGERHQGIPQFLPPIFLQQEAKFVDLGALAAPRVFDWDGDGYEDILSGNGAGDILFVKNQGGKTPVWGAPTKLAVDNIPLRIIASEAIPGTEDPHWGYTTIDVGDWDHDSLPDIIVNEHNGNIVWLRNVGTRQQPLLSSPQSMVVQWDGPAQKPAWTPGVSEDNDLLAPWRTSPFIMDFDEDGLNDLVILDYEGYLTVYPRIKDGSDLLLGHPQRNFVYPNGEPILLNQRINSSHGRLKITFSDWDGDGLEDLVFSSKPAVDWMKNMGKKDGKMILQYMGRVLSKTLMGHTDGPITTDFNKDGIPDLLVGTETGVLYYWERNDINITTTMTTTGKQTPANYKYFKR